MRQSALSLLRRLGRNPALEPTAALVLRGLTVRESPRFLAMEITRRSGLRGYTLRRNGLHVLIRHRTADVVTLGEVFHRPDYAFPLEVERRLASVRPLSVVDLGANIGLFGLWLFGERPDAQLTGFEPDPANAAVLRRAIQVNGLSSSWDTVQAAAGAENGDVSFRPGQFALSRLEEAGGARVALVDVLPLLGKAHLAKIDIEGGEWAILSDRRFPDHAPPVMVLEYHPHLAPHNGAPREVLERRLKECGYELSPIVHRPDGHGMVWAWRS